MDAPDRPERLLRLGCGAIFGFVVAAIGALSWGGLPWPWYAAFATFMVGFCAYAALRQGDAFWTKAAERRWWM